MLNQVVSKMLTGPTREYVQVLRLLEDFRLAHSAALWQDALRLGAIGFDAVKHLVRAASTTGRPASRRSIRLPANNRVTTTMAADYLMLLGAGAE